MLESQDPTILELQDPIYIRTSEYSMYNTCMSTPPLPSPQVIYILNTKNDEHAEFVEVLRGQHEAELQRVEGEGLVRLERCEQLCIGEADGLRATMTSLREELSKVEGEREQLYQTQVSFVV